MCQLQSSALIWSFVGLLFVMTPLGKKFWNPILSPQYIWSVFKAACLFAIIVLSAFKAVGSSLLLLEFSLLIHCRSPKLES